MIKHSKRYYERVMLPLYLIMLSTLLIIPRTYGQLQLNTLDLSNAHRIIGIVFSVLIMGSYFVQKKNIKIHNPHPVIFLLIYILSGILSTIFFSSLKIYSFWKIIELSTIFLFSIYLWNLPGEYYGRRAYELNLIFFKLLLIFIIINTIFSPTKTFTNLRGDAFLPIRIQGAVPIINSTQIGLLSAIVLFVTVVRGISAARMTWKTLIWLILTFVLLLFAQTRSSFIGLALAFLIYYLRLRDKEKLNLLLIIIPFLILVYLALPIFWKYLIRGHTYDSLLILSQRNIIWDLTIMTYNELPILGKLFGGGFATINRQVGLLFSSSGYVSTVDNEFLNALLSTGIIGALSMVSIYIILLTKALFSKPSRYNTELAGIMIMLTTRAFFNTHLALYSIFSPLFPAIIVLLYSKNHNSANEEG